MRTDETLQTVKETKKVRGSNFFVCPNCLVFVFSDTFSGFDRKETDFQTNIYQANYHHIEFCHPLASFTAADPGKLNNIWLLGKIHRCLNKIINKQSNLGK